PILLIVTNPLAVRTDRQQALELLQLAPQPENALGHREPGAQLVRVHRLGEEVVGSRPHPREVLFPAAARSDQDEVHVRLFRAGACNRVTPASSPGPRAPRRAAPRCPRAW